MNYLAHIHLAHISETSLLGNFLGDFVKGSQINSLSNKLLQGVLLHRKIDSYTDAHSCVKALKNRFPSSLRRMSGVILDVYFDHLLLIHWQHFSTAPPSDVLNEFYQQLGTENITLAGRYDSVKTSLLEHRWLSNYEQRDNVIQSFRQIEKRLNNRIEFATQADHYLKIDHRVIEEHFLAFYPQLIKYTITLT